ncbi:P-loop containing nucleoside triphosphate hydrolase protein, partial [Mycena maculata]
PELWQIYLISRILRGFDSIFLAGTGYGKSLIFEGLAVLGGNKKVVIVISPLKALERDQVDQARKKGIRAILINEDNTKSASLWKEARTTAQLVYISPEMACSDSFVQLWKDSKFRTRITTLFIDEAHCIHEWG